MTRSDTRNTFSSRRAGGSRTFRKRILVVCEGRVTEVQYLSRLRQRKKLTAAVVLKSGVGDPMKMVRFAKEQREMEADDPYDEVWCVFDTESPEPHPQLNDALTFAERNRINVGRSNPCFELWILIHLQNETSYLSTRDAQSKFTALGLSKSGKDLTEAGFVKLERGIADACERATALAVAHARDERLPPEDNPSSGVSSLISKLIG